MPNKKCDRVKNGKRCQNPAVYVSSIYLPRQNIEMKVNQCEYHCDESENTMESWAEAKFERQAINEKKTTISANNLV